jgi:23S rRNA pseudouridine955/2504/2580 synthase/23S rRNA pseudouridine1911/1915/1917 synthase
MRCAVRPENAGGSLVSFLAAKYPYHSAEEWTRLAAEGRVLLNAAPPDPGRVLAAGDMVQYFPAEAPEPQSDLAVTVLYEDPDLIVINKTGDLPVHPAGRYFKNTLWWLLRERLNVPEPSIVNRLDRETSGVTLVAKTLRAARSCREQFNLRSVVKKYAALIEGSFEGPVHARGYIAPAAVSAVRKKQQFYPSDAAGPEAGREAQWAETLFTPVKRAGDISLVEALPHTGRLHQIRAMLLSLGRPVVGDKLYGLDETVFLRLAAGKMTLSDAARMRVGRQALHAGSLSFRHPADGRPMTITAPLPPDMLGLLG